MKPYKTNDMPMNMRTLKSKSLHESKIHKNNSFLNVIYSLQENNELDLKPDFNVE